MVTILVANTGMTQVLSTTASRACAACLSQLLSLSQGPNWSA